MEVRVRLIWRNAERKQNATCWLRSSRVRCPRHDIPPEINPRLFQIRVNPHSDLSLCSSRCLLCRHSCADGWQRFTKIHQKAQRKARKYL
eukprot:2627172-Rhodomonas_salina.1